MLASGKKVSPRPLEAQLEGSDLIARAAVVDLGGDGLGVLLWPDGDSIQSRAALDGSTVQELLVGEVRRLLGGRPPRLSRPMLETLAIIAYRQPCTRPEIEAIRGVDVDAVLTTLLERRMIRIEGRKEAPGRPILYGTTPEFLEVFGLPDLEALPPLRDLGELAEILRATDLSITSEGIVPTEGGEDEGGSGPGSSGEPEGGS